MHKLKHIKNALINCVEKQVDCNLQHVNVEELGEVIDMIKDIEETMYYCSAIKAMEGQEYSDMNDYVGKLYSDNPYIRYMIHSDPRRMFTEYPINGDLPHQDEREGHSHKTRKAYLEAKEHHDEDKQTKELEKYIKELSAEILEMIPDSTTADKQMLQQKLTTLSTKIK